MFGGYDHKSKWATVGFNDSNKKIRFQFFKGKKNIGIDRKGMSIVLAFVHS